MSWFASIILILVVAVLAGLALAAVALVAGFLWKRGGTPGKVIMVTAIVGTVVALPVVLAAFFWISMPGKASEYAYEAEYHRGDSTYSLHASRTESAPPVDAPAPAPDGPTYPTAIDPPRADARAPRPVATSSAGLGGRHLLADRYPQRGALLTALAYQVVQALDAVQPNEQVRVVFLAEADDEAVSRDFADAIRAQGPALRVMRLDGGLNQFDLKNLRARMTGPAATGIDYVGVELGVSGAGASEKYRVLVDGPGGQKVFKTMLDRADWVPEHLYALPDYDAADHDLVVGSTGLSATRHQAENEVIEAAVDALAPRLRREAMAGTDERLAGVSDGQIRARLRAELREQLARAIEAAERDQTPVALARLGSPLITDVYTQRLQRPTGVTLHQIWVRLDATARPLDAAAATIAHGIESDLPGHHDRALAITSLLALLVVTFTVGHAVTREHDRTV